MAIDSISSLQAVNNLLNYGSVSGVGEAAQNSEFRDILAQAISNTENTSADSSAYVDALLMGTINDMHDVGIASSEAELAISLTVQIRDRIVDAYGEIMRMQV